MGRAPFDGQAPRPVPLALSLRLPLLLLGRFLPWDVCVSITTFFATTFSFFLTQLPVHFFDIPESFWNGVSHSETKKMCPRGCSKWNWDGMKTLKPADHQQLKSSRRERRAI